MAFIVFFAGLISCRNGASKHSIAIIKMDATGSAILDS
jgi:hypothetical protein